MAAPVARTRSRSVVATAVAALVLFVLSGCVKFNADFHVDAEETLTGTMQILVDPIALEDMGSNPSSELDDAVSDAQADPELPDGVTVDRVEDEDGYIGMGVNFDRVPAAELQNGGSGLDDVGVEGIEVVHTDGEISFTMANPLTAGMDSSDPFGSSGMPSSARSIFDEARVSITFPGNVIAADGAETDGKTATWNLREYDGDTLTATGDASSFPWGVVLIAGGVLLFLLIAAGVIILVLVLRKKSTAAGARTTAYAPAGPGVPGYPATSGTGPPYVGTLQHPNSAYPQGGASPYGPPHGSGPHAHHGHAQPGSNQRSTDVCKGAGPAGSGYRNELSRGLPHTGTSQPPPAPQHPGPQPPSGAPRELGEQNNRRFAPPRQSSMEPRMPQPPEYPDDTGSRP
ncbi:LppM family (lipo)protein [Brevibacterium yomogidense]|uniref:LppM family (lipo)protein n=1 Tax=Brevibacterium yomogidense TaxID=946573 RepID=UPI0018E01F42|nr:hypothetical protein [Brevibacterium yomogidense]